MRLEEMKTERDLIKAIKELDPFQAPNDNLQVERDVWTQSMWVVLAAGEEAVKEEIEQ